MVTLGKAYKKDSEVVIPCGVFYKDIYNVRVYRPMGTELMLQREDKMQESEFAQLGSTSKRYDVDAVKGNTVLTASDLKE